MNLKITKVLSPVLGSSYQFQSLRYTFKSLNNIATVIPRDFEAEARDYKEQLRKLSQLMAQHPQLCYTDPNLSALSLVSSGCSIRKEGNTS